MSLQARSACSTASIQVYQVVQIKLIKDHDIRDKLDGLFVFEKGLYLVHEFIDVLELPVDRSEPDVSDFVEFLQG